jgi:hypothetical protein
LAPDVLDDRVEFPSAKEALVSISPMYRVYIGENGSITSFLVKHQEGAFAGSSLWPANASDWLSASSAPASNPIWRRCRTGFLHHDDSGQNNSSTLRPKGRPITDVVNTTLLKNKQWWIDD